jgi:hypothetical protein
MEAIELSRGGGGVVAARGVYRNFTDPRVHNPIGSTEAKPSEPRYITNLLEVKVHFSLPLPGRNFYSEEI